MKNIVIIGGGTGTFTLLAGLRKFPSNNSVIVSSADDGGSTGVLRRELGVMPAGDIRQCLVGLSYTDPEMRKIFSYRFAGGSLAGHTVGNIMIAAAEKVTGGIEQSIALSAKMLNVRGSVLPITLFPTKLSAVLADGTVVVGEHHIDEPGRARKSPIASLRIKPSAPANPSALSALKKADAIIFGPGDLFTSVLPNIIVKGVSEAIRASSAKKILVTNIMTRQGQTDGFRASDFARVLATYLGTKASACPIDIVLVNNKKPDAKLLAHYRKEKAQFVEPDIERVKKMGIVPVVADFLSREAFGRASGDPLKRSVVRHDSDKTALAIWKLIS